MGIRTDLMIEHTTFAKEFTPDGVTRNVVQRGHVTITRIAVETEQAAQRLAKPQGNYLTLEMDSLKGYSSQFEQEVELIGKEISSLLPKQGLIFVVGLGNSQITPDDIGPHTCRYVLATRHLINGIAEQTGLDMLRPVAVASPGVLGQTGMETVEMIAGICQKIKPSAVVVVDALAARDINRLGRTIQISDTGIVPGSGVQNRRKELSIQTLGVPVIAIGVPTVVDMATIASDLLQTNCNIPDRAKTMMVTPREIDQIVAQSSKMLAMGINCALQPELSVSELMGLTA